MMNTHMLRSICQDLDKQVRREVRASAAHGPMLSIRLVSRILGKDMMRQMLFQAFAEVNF